MVSAPKGRQSPHYKTNKGPLTGRPGLHLGPGELKLWWSPHVRARLSALGCRAAVELIVANVCSVLGACSELAQWWYL